MNPTAIRFALVAILCVLCGVFGWAIRGWRADAVEARRDASDAQTETANVTEVRKDDKDSQAGAAVVEQQRVEQQAQAATEFKYITREVIRYVASNPSPAGCGLSADGLRIWRQSSAGKAAGEPGRSPVADGAVSR
ncbi:hypothetical protein [Bradyrhizobium yuanmingense]|uniref:hypothetical protein n=1 Tax=Bradyrhizobium yuanmingense TaxID=108015 RepID=UPI0004B6DBF0|nr:hypothetical protein [Bradyrhizobium yuanmingense]